MNNNDLIRESVIGDIMDVYEAMKSLRDTDGWRSSVRPSLFTDFVTPTASKMTKWSLFVLAEGETFLNSSRSIVLVPLPFICS